MSSSLRTGLSKDERVLLVVRRAHHERECTGSRKHHSGDYRGVILKLTLLTSPTATSSPLTRTRPCVVGGPVTRQPNVPEVAPLLETGAASRSHVLPPSR